MNWPGATARRSVDRRRDLGFDQLGVLDHHHRVGAARDDAAGRDRGRGAGQHLDGGRDAAGDHLGIERKPPRRAVARARGVGGAHARSRRHWRGRTAAHRSARRRRPRARGRAPRRAATVSPASGARSMQASKRRRASSAETTSRNCSCRAARRTASRIARDRGRRLRFGGFVHGHGLTATGVPAAKPSLSAGTRIQPSLRGQRFQRQITRGERLRHAAGASAPGPVRPGRSSRRPCA